MYTLYLQVLAVSDQLQVMSRLHCAVLTELAVCVSARIPSQQQSSCFEQTLLPNQRKLVEIAVVLHAQLAENTHGDWVHRMLLRKQQHARTCVDELLAGRV